MTPTPPRCRKSEHPKGKVLGIIKTFEDLDKLTLSPDVKAILRDALVIARPNWRSMIA